MRRSAAALLIATLAAAGAQAVAATAPAQAAAATAAGGYVALPTEVRLLDATTVSHGGTVAVTVAGRGGLPASGVGSVLISLTASKATATGALVAYSGTKPGTTNVRFEAGRTSTGTALVAVSGGKITIANAASTGTVSVLADVAGYYTTAPASPQPGAYHPVTPTRLVDTRAGVFGNAAKPVPAHATTEFTIGGKGPIPRTAEVAAMTITVVNPASAGTLRVGRTGEVATPVSTVHFDAGKITSAFTVMGLGTGVEDASDVGRVSVLDNSAASAEVVIDVVGYYDAGVAQDVGATRWLPAARVSQPSVQPATPTSVALAGLGGTPRAGIGAAIVTLHVVSPTVSGSLQAYRSGVTRPTSTAVLRWSAGQTTAVTTVVPVSSTGRFAIYSIASKAVTIAIDVQGFVPSTSVAPPDTKSIARYLDDLVVVKSASDLQADTMRMHGHGCDDATAQRDYVLLDLGAQTITAPLSVTNPGILLVGPNEARISYPDLATILGGYLAGYAECAPGQSATLAIGTNNDGTWTTYRAAQRGTDFADLVDAVAAKATSSVTVVGANDIESDFGTQKAADVLAWEKAYLAATSRKLVFNGTLGGCPRTFGAPTGTCTHGWTLAQYKAMTVNGSRITVLPQIYFDYQATQWANLDAYVRSTGAAGLRYDGSLTQYAADQRSFTPAQGWASLYWATSAVTTGPALPHAVDIGYSG